MAAVGVRLGGCCNFHNCNKGVRAKGLCSGHYMQAYRGEVLRPLRPASPKDVYEYYQVHHRLRKERGRAAEYICVICGASAAEWAFTGNPATSLYKEVINRRGKKTRMFYSKDLTEYHPMCHSCHIKVDALVKSRGWQPWACA